MTRFATRSRDHSAGRHMGMRFPGHRMMISVFALFMLVSCGTGTEAGRSPAVLSGTTFVSTSVGRLAVWDTGSPGAGREEQVIVLWPSILADHGIYREQIEAWRHRYRLIVIDGPGHGRSGPPPETFTMAMCARAVEEILDARRIAQPVVVVGTSWGGLVAGEFALSLPHRTRAVVMLNTPVNAPEKSVFDHFVVWSAYWLHGTSMFQDGVANDFFLPSTRSRGGPVMESFTEQLRFAHGGAMSRAVASVLIDREPLASRMQGIAAPTLFIVGRFDTLYPPETLRRPAAKLPDGRFVVLDTAHISVVDAPAQTTATIDEFLASLPPVLPRQAP